MKNAIVYTFVFLAIQVMAGFIVDGIWRWAFGKGAMDDATGISLRLDSGAHARTAQYR